MVSKPLLKITYAFIAVLFCFGCQSSISDGDITDKATKSDQIIVIGAGLAGLNAALQLESAGFDITVLEARNRVGGRLYTLDEIPGTPEAGGNLIGASYARVVDTASRLGLELLPLQRNAINSSRGLFIDGQHLSYDKWASHKSNPFPEALKALPPSRTIGATFKQNPIAEPSDWLTDSAKQFDIPLSRYLTDQGFSKEARGLATHSSGYGLDAGDSSLLQWYKNAALYKAGAQFKGAFTVAGGNQRLPEAMAAALQGDIHLQQVVTEIRQEDERVFVLTKDGKQYSANYVVAALPFTALRNIKISPALPEIQQQAIDNLSYSHVLQAHLLVSEDYTNGQALNLWTDTIIEQTFVSADESGTQARNIIVWINGENAKMLSDLSPEDRDALIMQRFYRIYPDAQGKVELKQVVDWGKDPYAGGSWADWAPGQISQYAQSVAKPVGRLYFAGEHTAVVSPGMEGAMESGERTAMEIIAADTAANNKSNNDVGEKLFLACIGCHSIEAGAANKLGPNLNGLLGSPTAYVENYDYSEELRSANLTWNRETLRSWINNPAQLVPGNKMIYQNHLSDAEIDHLIDYISTYDKE